MSHLHRLSVRLFAVGLSLLVALPAQAELFRLRAKAPDELISPQAGPILAAPVVGSSRIAASPIYGSTAAYPSAACHVPCIKYKDHVGRHSCFACKPTVEMVLQVQSPCSCCCLVDIPVCIPACCVDTPCVDSRGGLFGREIVNYEWKCGFRVKIVFDRHGDALVHYLD